MRATVFGGTGFLGRRIVTSLVEASVTTRIAARHPEKAQDAPEPSGLVERVQADIRDEASARSAIEGSDAVVNAVGLYVEKGNATFKAIHVDGARRVAALAQERGVERLVHLSGIGSDVASRSPYIRSRGQGEEAVREAMRHATLFRPSVLFAKDDTFLNALVSLVRRAPVIPLFGNGETRLQPVFAGDVAQAVTQALTQTEAPRPVYELGGPDVLSYRAILQQVMEAIDRRPVLLPVPFFAWDALAAAFSLLPTPMITEGQVALLKHDNVAAPDMPGLAALNMSPRPLAAVLKEIASTS